MPQLKRDVVKYVRDKAKSKYEKGSACEICDSTEALDFHHFYSLAPLLRKWLRENKFNLEISYKLSFHFRPNTGYRVY